MVGSPCPSWGLPPRGHRRRPPHFTNRAALWRATYLFTRGFDNFCRVSALAESWQNKYGTDFKSYSVTVSHSSATRGPLKAGILFKPRFNHFCAYMLPFTGYAGPPLTMRLGCQDLACRDLQQSPGSLGMRLISWPQWA